MLHPDFMFKLYYNHIFYSIRHVLSGTIKEVLGALFKVFALLTVMKMKNDGSDAVLCLGILQITFVLTDVVRNTADLYPPFLLALQRFRELEEFLHTDCQEPADGQQTPAGWPSKGHLVLEDVTFRYSVDAPVALQSLSLEVEPGEKLGVVGKTGSGKSTLTILLHRLGSLRTLSAQSQGCSGRVLLDGIDVSTLRLSALRRAVTLVPQEPTVFSGWSLKENVGREYTDAEVLATLERCGLDARSLTSATSLQEALKSALTAGSLSLGQRQLLSLSRALVRRPRILILDEVTSALDRQTADKLMEVMAVQNLEATVLSIAHRLRFVIKSNRILVLGTGGQVLACDTPAKLLEDEDGYFAVNYRLEQAEEARS
eukprot:gnl/TRDRNA2_/TRDRNA2_150004_c1_seq1.p1 gnl/TRDRNA2_/TRDRNA2_150004_c1~~gnl/TRDRNA2_/TRDRNA2_150004_c1_seq1.p1  ORF type:complete len:391 (+),score=66.49 gnl/TRDRNA2_/TRDRNA2_150004_c1_seq1:59-1174(+)